MQPSDSPLSLVVQPLTILVVEDSPEQRTYYREILELQGRGRYRWHEAELCQEGLDFCEQFRPDCILLDYRLPDMDGIEFMAELNDTEGRDIPVIMITSQGDERVAVQAIQHGASDYLVKEHIDAEALEHALQQAIGRKRSDAQLQRYTQGLADLNAQLIDSTQRLRSLNEQKDRFFAIVSHDLRSPAGSLFRLAEFVHENFDQFSREELHECVGVIHRSARKVFTLLENLLRWSQVQMGQVQSRPVLFRLGDSIDAVRRLLSDNASSKELLLRMPTANPQVYADRDMTDFVLRNVIANAIKFTPPGGTIEVEVSRKADHVVVSVTDTGTGMTPAAQARLFREDVCFSTRGTAGEQGTGLGLILCKSFLERQGGTIEVASVLGEGTTIQFTLPTAP